MKENGLFSKLEATIGSLDPATIPSERKIVLQPLIDYLNFKISKNEAIRLNFICTHNSRRSHLSQVWAQALSGYLGITNIQCYSGGTEATALYPKVAETLSGQGFKILTLATAKNPIYALKFSGDAPPIVCFSKTYDSDFNPKSGFGAIMTCDSANEACPMVLGAENRFSITYTDPKKFDGTPKQDKAYLERSVQIATELLYVFNAAAKSTNSGV